MKLQIVVDELWKHKNELYCKRKLNGMFVCNFEYPNYSNISRKISNKLDSDQVDSIQAAIYELNGIIKNKSQLKKAIRDNSYGNTWEY